MYQRLHACKENDDAMITNSSFPIQFQIVININMLECTNLCAAERRDRATD